MLIICLTIFTSLLSAEETQSRVGYAYDKENEQLLYSENHYEFYNEGMVLRSRVVYKDAAEKVIANKTVDFSRNLFMPEFNLRNSETGHVEKTRFINNEYEVTFISLESEVEKNARLTYPINAISDAGFDNFIIKHWAELNKGEVFKREFLIPSMLDFITFRIYQDAVINEQGESLRVINIEPDSFFIRAFAGTTKLFYEKEKPKLKRFDGVSNMRDSNGDNYSVIIKYKEFEKLASNH